MTPRAIFEILEENSVSLFLANGNLKFSAPVGHYTPELRRLVADHRADILEFFATKKTGEKKTPEPCDSYCQNLTAIQSWLPEIAVAVDFVLLLTPDDLTADPRHYGPEVVRIDRAKHLAAIQADVRRGPKGPRAMYGAIQEDVTRLRAIVLMEANPS